MNMVIFGNLVPHLFELQVLSSKYKVYATLSANFTVDKKVAGDERTCIRSKKEEEGDELASEF